MNPNEKIDHTSVEAMLGAIQEIMLDLTEEYANVPTDELLEFEVYDNTAKRETDALMTRLMKKA